MGNKAPGAGTASRSLHRFRDRWVLCLDDKQKERFKQSGVRASDRRRESELSAQRVEELTLELFRLQDLKKDGLLEESELIKLNQKIAMLHHGMDADLGEVEKKYKALFRENLDEAGNPVSFDTYREYLLRVLNSVDRDPEAQEMILEQWVAEAESARATFMISAMRSASDAEFLEKLHPPGTPDLAFGESNLWCDGDAGKQSSVKSWRPPAADSIRPEGADHESLRSTPSRPPAADITRPGGADHGSLRATPPRPPAADSTGPGAAGRASLRETPSRPPTADGSGPAGVGATPPRNDSVSTAYASTWDDGVVTAPATMSEQEVPASLSTPPRPRGSTSDHAGARPTPSRHEPPFSPPSRSSPSHPRDDPQAADRPQSQTRFAAGETVQVWSVSQKAWLDGVVDAVFATSTVTEGFTVPAGTVKVSYAAGTKWVYPAVISTTLRKGGAESRGGAGAVSSARRFSKGDAVEIWSESKRAWLRGVVQEFYASEAEVDSYRVPAGTLLVRSSAGVKWVLPEKISKLLRAASSEKTSPPSGVFSKGDSVQVWSDRRQAWVAGTVEEVFDESAHCGGFSVPAGTLKISTASGVKLVMPQNFGRHLRSADCPSTPERAESCADSWRTDPSTAGAGAQASTIGSEDSAAGVKAQIAETLGDRRKLQSRVEAAWALLDCSLEAAIPERRIPGVLEDLALQFDVRLNLDDEHVAFIRQRYKAFALEAPGHISILECCDLCQELLSELYSMC